MQIAVFLGCERGEIELGMSNIPQVSTRQIKSYFLDKKLQKCLIG